MTVPGAQGAAALASGLQEVFAAELEEQLQAAAAALPLASQGPDRCRELRRIFHTIKGGAGLVGRSDLAESAEQLEHFFADPLVGGAPEQGVLDVLFGAAKLPVPTWAPVVGALRAPAAAAPVRAVLLGIGAYRLALPLAAIERAVVLDLDAVLPPDAGGTPLVLHERLGLPPPRGRLAALALRGSDALLLADRLGAPRPLSITAGGPLLAAHPFIGGLSVDAQGTAYPVLDAARLIVLGSAAANAVPDGPLRQVLAVDDSMLIRRAVADVLGEVGVTFDLASDGHDALVKLARGRYAVVLTDLEMPGLDGYGLIAALRADRRWREQPIVVCSSCLPVADARLDALGIQGYIAKPFANAALLAVLQPFLKGGE